MNEQPLPSLPTLLHTRVVDGIPCISVSEHEHLMREYALQAIALATQAEVTDGIRPEDFTVDVVVKPIGGFAPANTQGVRVTHKPTGISVTCDAARSQHTNRHQAFEKLSAILAQRPAAVPMTDEEIEQINCVTLHQTDWDSFEVYEPSVRHFARAIEAHHGITVQPQKGA